MDTRHLSIGARYLMRGDTSDPEDFRTTYRLRAARSILHGLGIDPIVKHCLRCEEDAKSVRGRLGCWDDCKTSWPDWVTPEMFEHAYLLADKVQTKRGEYEREKAAEKFLQES